MNFNSIDEVKTYLENNNLTLEELADELGVNSDFYKTYLTKNIYSWIPQI